MSTSSIKPVPTLKGIFSVPKINHRRDFLRENKLSLRDMERISNNKKVEQIKQQKQTLGYRRSSSQQRERDQAKRTQSRASSQQRDSKGQISPPYAASSVASMRSVRPVISKTESCDKEIQTEDIHDKEFLYDALKKCSNCDVVYKANSTVFNSTSNTSVPHPNGNANRYNDELDDNKHSHYNEEELHLQTMDNMSEENLQIPIASARSRGSIMNGYPQQIVDEDLNDHFGNLAVENSYEQNDVPLSGRSRQTITSNYNQDNLNLKKSNKNVNKVSSGISLAKKKSSEVPLSARSRQTTVSNQDDLHSKVSARSVNNKPSPKGRDDVRLPRYLEREKREKEEQLMREVDRDPFCPPGHYALSEEERLAALAQAKSKFQELINELNHMPMTSETLRVRTRKGEIEKTLVEIEADIRFFSKAKVYVQPD